MSEDEHDCTTCGTHFTGNYCPRCGQSAKIGRYSFKKAFLLFLDVWGLGNRGMFRTLRDLLLRPGYMIRDYLQGMQMAYFPPFKMFFLLVTLSLLVDSGLNIFGENHIKQGAEAFERGIEMSQNDKWEDENDNPFAVNYGVEGWGEKADSGVKADSSENTDSVKVGGIVVEMSDEDGDDDEDTRIILKEFFRWAKIAYEWVQNHMTMVMLVGLLIVSWPLFFMFRRCPAIPDLRFSEFFVATVYITNMMNIYSIVRSFLCINGSISTLVSLLAIVALKQLTGYGYRRTILKVVAGLAIFFLIAGLLFGLTCVLAIAAITYYNNN